MALVAYYLGTLVSTMLTPGSGLPRIRTVHGLQIDPSMLELGEVWETPLHKVPLKIKNVAVEARTIIEFASGCDCLGAEPGAMTIPSGGMADLSLSLDLTHRQPYQLGLAQWPVTVSLRPVFQKDFAPTPGWERRTPPIPWYRGRGSDRTLRSSSA